MSEAVQIALVNQIPAIIAAVFGFITTLLVLLMRSKVKKLEHNTNGMQATISKLAHDAGVIEERDREKP